MQAGQAPAQVLLPPASLLRAPLSGSAAGPVARCQQPAHRLPAAAWAWRRAWGGCTAPSLRGRLPEPPGCPSRAPGPPLPLPTSPRARAGRAAGCALTLHASTRARERGKQAWPCLYEGPVDQGRQQGGGSAHWRGDAGPGAGLI